VKPDEIAFFKTFLSVHPNFLDIKKWVPGPDPPDVIITDVRDRPLGLELTEWLDREQTTPSISNQDNEMKWLEILNSEDRPRSQKFQFVQVEFHDGTRYSQREETSFSQEFRSLISYVEENWEREMEGTLQKISNDFTKYPTLAKHVSLIWFHNWPGRESQRWVLGTPKGGAYDPQRMTRALLERIEEKKNKPNYVNLKIQHKLAELVLLVHYGIRGLIHNPPVRKIEDVVLEARANLARNPGRFDQVFLYLAYNEGHLFTLYP
jgi:hypothetical protein